MLTAGVWRLLPVDPVLLREDSPPVLSVGAAVSAAHFFAWSLVGRVRLLEVVERALLPKLRRHGGGSRVAEKAEVDEVSSGPSSAEFA